MRDEDGNIIYSRDEDGNIIGGALPQATPGQGVANPETGTFDAARVLRWGYDDAGNKLNPGQGVANTATGTFDAAPRAPTNIQDLKSVGSISDLNALLSGPQTVGPADQPISDKITALGYSPINPNAPSTQPSLTQAQMMQKVNPGGKIVTAGDGKQYWQIKPGSWADAGFGGKWTFADFLPAAAIATGGLAASAGLFGAGAEGALAGNVIGDLSGFGAGEFVTPEMLSQAVANGTLTAAQAAEISASLPGATGATTAFGGSEVPLEGGGESGGLPEAGQVDELGNPISDANGNPIQYEQGPAVPDASSQLFPGGSPTGGFNMDYFTKTPLSSIVQALTNSGISPASALTAGQMLAKLAGGGGNISQADSATLSNLLKGGNKSTGSSVLDGLLGLVGAGGAIADYLKAPNTTGFANTLMNKGTDLVNKPYTPFSAGAFSADPRWQAYITALTKPSIDAINLNTSQANATADARAAMSGQDITAYGGLPGRPDVTKKLNTQAGDTAIGKTVADATSGAFTNAMNQYSATYQYPLLTQQVGANTLKAVQPFGQSTTDLLKNVTGALGGGASPSGTSPIGALSNLFGGSNPTSTSTAGTPASTPAFNVTNDDDGNPIGSSGTGTVQQPAFGTNQNADANPLVMDPTGGGLAYA